MSHEMGSVCRKATLVVGLGNPGPKYAGNRHNVGYCSVDRLAQIHGLRFRSSPGSCQHKALVASGCIGGVQVVLIKPQSFMNESGRSVGSLVRWYKIAPSDVLVICDDLDLPLGRIRLKSRGTSGGHKGLQSVIEALQTEEFARLRVGIGRPTCGEPTEYVLSDFDLEQRAAMEATYDRVALAVWCYISQGIQAAMNEFNSAPEDGGRS